MKVKNVNVSYANEFKIRRIDVLKDKLYTSEHVDFLSCHEQGEGREDVSDGLLTNHVLLPDTSGLSSLSS